MNRREITTIVVGILMVAAIATFAVVSAVQADDDGGDLTARVIELEERVEELESQIGRGPFGFGGEQRLGDLFGGFFGEQAPEDLLQGLQEQFDQEFSDDLLQGLLEGLGQSDALGDTDQLTDLLDLLREAFEGE